jgi:hypothetical protein
MSYKPLIQRNNEITIQNNLDIPNYKANLLSVNQIAKSNLNILLIANGLSIIPNYIERVHSNICGQLYYLPAISKNIEVIRIVDKKNFNFLFLVTK